MKVCEAFKDPEFSNFTREAVRVGEALEALGYELDGEGYHQGIQRLFFNRRPFRLDVHLDQKEIDEEV